MAKVKKAPASAEAIKEARLLRALLRDQAFLGLVRVSGLPDPVMEHAFAAPERKFRFDYCWREQMVALEVEGGAYTGGRHTRGPGFVKDLAKYSLAAAMGWRVLRVTPMQLATDYTIDLLKRAFAYRETP